ncbi:hypothetical protein D0U04_29820 [Bacillus clarus]|uniref:Uncharacterized protein n=2 Tax=Bacillus clarus TaxID=2338372 RepID=A0ABX9KLW8_9BACI|nr:hypothetical protein D0U04_29820 [Bacillus clarus]
MFVYFHFPLNIDFSTILLISSKYTTKVYIQKTINKKVRTFMNKKEKARYMLAFYISSVIESYHIHVLKENIP